MTIRRRSPPGLLGVFGCSGTGRSSGPGSVSRSGRPRSRARRQHAGAVQQETPATWVLLPVTGLAAGDTLKAIDYRPANGLLYAIATDGSNTLVRTYTINPTTRAATALGNAATLPTPGSSWTSTSTRPWTGSAS